MKYIAVILFAVTVYYLIRLSATIKRVERKNVIDLALNRTNHPGGNFLSIVESADSLYRDYMFSCFKLDIGKIMRATMLMERFFLSIDAIQNEETRKSEWLDVLSELGSFCSNAQNIMEFWIEMNAQYAAAWSSFDVKNADHVKFVFSNKTDRPISFRAVISNIITSAKKAAITSIYGNSFYRKSLSGN